MNEYKSISELLKNGSLLSDEENIASNNPLIKSLNGLVTKIQASKDPKEILNELENINNFLESRDIKNNKLAKELTNSLETLFEVSTAGLGSDYVPTIFSNTLLENQELLKSLFSKMIDGMVTVDDNENKLKIDVATMLYLNHNELITENTLGIIKSPVIKSGLMGIDFTQPEFDFNDKFGKDELLKYSNGFKTYTSLKLLDKQIKENLEKKVEDKETLETFTVSTEEINKKFEEELSKNLRNEGLKDKVIKDFGDELTESELNEKIGQLEGQLTEEELLAIENEKKEYYEKQQKIIDNAFEESNFVFTSQKNIDKSLLENDSPNISPLEIENYDIESLKDLEFATKEFYRKHNLKMLSVMDKIKLKVKPGEENPFWLSSGLFTPCMIVEDKYGTPTNDLFKTSVISGNVTFSPKSQTDPVALEASLYYSKNKGWKTLYISHTGDRSTASAYIEAMLHTIESQKPPLYTLEQVQVPKKYQHLLDDFKNRNKASLSATAPDNFDEEDDQDFENERMKKTQGMTPSGKNNTKEAQKPVPDFEDDNDLDETIKNDPTNPYSESQKTKEDDSNNLESEGKNTNEKDVEKHSIQSNNHRIQEIQSNNHSDFPNMDENEFPDFDGMPMDEYGEDLHRDDYFQNLDEMGAFDELSDKKPEKNNKKTGARPTKP